MMVLGIFLVGFILMVAGMWATVCVPSSLLDWPMLLQIFVVALGSVLSSIGCMLELLAVIELFTRWERK